MAVAPELAGLVDYLSIALGDSSTYRGSTGIVPPPPVEESAIAGFAAPFRVGPPLIATSRIVDPAAADRLIADGVADAVGMTRALITDPDLPRKAATGERTTSSAASAATPASRTTTPPSRSRAPRILGPDAS